MAQAGQSRLRVEHRRYLSERSKEKPRRISAQQARLPGPQKSRGPPRNYRRGPRLTKAKRCGRLFLLVLLALFGLAALLARFETVFTALGAVGGALDELGTYQLDHRHLGAIALARAQARDARVAAAALAEARAQRVEQFLHRSRRAQRHRRLAAGSQRVLLGECDHLLDQRAACLGLGHGG